MPMMKNQASRLRTIMTRTEREAGNRSRCPLFVISLPKLDIVSVRKCCVCRYVAWPYAKIATENHGCLKKVTGHLTQGIGKQ
jgi:hypothetical protein